MKKINRRELQAVTQKHLGKNIYQARQMVEMFNLNKIAEVEKFTKKKSQYKAEMAKLQEMVKNSVEAQMKEIGGN